MKSLYFAYGSNLNDSDFANWFQQGELRIPELKNPRVACLKDHRLDFTRFSKKRNGGVADIVCDKGKSVYGILFETTDDDLRILDRKEGVESGAYRRILVTVDLSQNKKVSGVATYEVINKGSVHPNYEYVQLIIDGAKAYGLPEQWIEKLESFKHI